MDLNCTRTANTFCRCWVRRSSSEIWRTRVCASSRPLTNPSRPSAFRRVAASSQPASRARWASRPRSSCGTSSRTACSRCTSNTRSRWPPSPSRPTRSSSAPWVESTTAPSRSSTFRATMRPCVRPANPAWSPTRSFSSTTVTPRSSQPTTAASRSGPSTPSAATSTRRVSCLPT